MSQYEWKCCTKYAFNSFTMMVDCIRRHLGKDHILNGLFPKQPATGAKAVQAAFTTNVLEYAGRSPVLYALKSFNVTLKFFKVL